MGVPTFESENPFTPQSYAAVVLSRTEHGNLHVGLLHKAEGGSVAVLHLGWEDALSRDWEWSKLWASPEVEPERLRAIGGLCRLIWNEFETTGKFPYGIHLESQHFTLDGKLQLDPKNERGLTCATFVLTVFKSAGLNLVDLSSWPVRGEADRKFLEMVRGFAKPNLFDSLSAEVDAGCVRVQPQEVLGACEFQLPASFDDVNDAGLRAERSLST